MNWRLRALVAVLFAGMIALAGNSSAVSAGENTQRPRLEQVGQVSGRGSRGAGMAGTRLRGEDGQHGMFRGVFRDLLRVVSEAAGLSPRELAAQVQQGRTLADLIRLNNGSIDEVVRQAATIIGERIQQAVANGRLSQMRADALIAELPQRISEVLNGEQREDRGVERRLVRGVLHLAAEQTGLSPRDLREQLGTRTLAQVLAEHGVGTAAFVETAASQLAIRLEARIAEGRLNATQAEAMLGDFRTRLVELLGGAIWI